MTDKCQIGHCNVNHLLVVIRGLMPTTSIFLVDGYAYNMPFCGIFGVVTANMFSLVNKMMLNHWVNIFSNYFESLSLACKFVSLSCGSLHKVV